MKQRNLIRRLTAALVSGAMALSLCAPALAAADEPAATLQPAPTPRAASPWCTRIRKIPSW